MSEYCFRNLVFEGGGVKGTAYAGAVEVLHELGVLKNIARVGGTSAGSITALVLGLGYAAAEAKEILLGIDYNAFKDDSFLTTLNLWRVTTQYGWYRGDKLRDWIRSLIAKQGFSPDITFAEFSARRDPKRQPDVYFVGADVSTLAEVVFSTDTTPEWSLADAVRVSISVPLFFAAVTKRRNTYVDGGVVLNYPVKLFDRERYVERHARLPDYYHRANQAGHGHSRETGFKFVYNKETLGFRVDSEGEIATFHGDVPEAEPIDGFKDYLVQLVKTVLNVQDRAHLHSDDWQRTVYINAGTVGPLDFDLTNAQKEVLMEAGRHGVRAYFEWYNDRTSINHPDNPSDKWARMDDPSA